MEVAAQHNADFLDMAVKLEQEEKPCSLHEEESHTSPGTSSGFPDITVKLKEEDDEEEKPCGLHQQKSETIPGTDSGFYDVTVKLEKEEQPGDLPQQESETFPGTSLGFPDTVVKEEEEGESCNQGSEDIAGVQSVPQSWRTERETATMIEGQRVWKQRGNADKQGGAAKSCSQPGVLGLQRTHAMALRAPPDKIHSFWDRFWAALGGPNTALRQLAGAPGACTM